MDERVVEEEVDDGEIDDEVDLRARCKSLEEDIALHEGLICAGDALFRADPVRHACFDASNRDSARFIGMAKLELAKLRGGDGG